MKWIISFESWVVSGSSDNILFEYKLCRDCNSLYRTYKPKYSVCKYCGSKDLLIITEEEYYDGIRDRINDPLEWENILKDRENYGDVLRNLGNQFIDYTY